MYSVSYGVAFSNNSTHIVCHVHSDDYIAQHCTDVPKLGDVYERIPKCFNKEDIHL